MQICTSLQTDNHTSTPPLSFYRLDALPAALPTVSKPPPRHLPPKITIAQALTRGRCLQWLFSGERQEACVCDCLVFPSVLWLAIGWQEGDASHKTPFHWVQLIHALAHQCISHCQHLKNWKSLTSLKLVSDTQLQQLTLTVAINLNFYCTNNAPFATGNKHTANDVSCFCCTNNAPFATRNKHTANDVWCFSVFWVPIGRYVDAFISCTALH